MARYGEIGLKGFLRILKRGFLKSTAKGWGVTAKSPQHSTQAPRARADPERASEGSARPRRLAMSLIQKRMTSSEKRQPPHAAGAPGPECPPSAGLPRRRVELGYGRVTVLGVVKKTFLYKNLTHINLPPRLSTCKEDLSLFLDILRIFP